MSVWAGFLSFFLFLPESNCPSVSAFTNFYFFLLFPSCFLSPAHSPPVFHAGSLDELSFFFCSLSFYCLLRPCPFCLSVLWYPFLFSVFVGCHVSVSPLLSLQLCPRLLPLALISAQFPSHSLSLCRNLNYAPFFPQMSQYCIFSSPFFFRVTSFSVPPFCSIFFTGVCKAGIYIFSGQAARGERPAGRSKAAAVKRSERVRH